MHLGKGSLEAAEGKDDVDELDDLCIFDLDCGKDPSGLSLLIGLTAAVGFSVIDEIVDNVFLDIKLHIVTKKKKILLYNNMHPET